MVKYVGEAEFDYHSLNYGRDAHAVRAEVAIYRPAAIVAAAAAAIIADVGRISVVIERINAVIAGGRSLIIAIPIDSSLFSILTRVFKFSTFNAFSFTNFYLYHGVFLCEMHRFIYTYVI